MYHNSRVPAALFGLLTVIPVFAQQPKFEIADVHVSPTVRTFAQNFGGVLREGRYLNRDATMLNLIVAAYGVSEDNIARGPGGSAGSGFGAEHQSRLPQSDFASHRGKPPPDGGRLLRSRRGRLDET